jgi:hypothetical protein
MKQRNRLNWYRRLALGLALVALSAPASSASGGVSPDTSPPPGVFESGVPGGGYVSDAVVSRPGAADPFESGIPGGGYVPEDTTTVLVPGADPTGVDWTTVAIGLGAGVAGLLAGAAIALAKHRRGTPARA